MAGARFNHVRRDNCDIQSLDTTETTPQRVEVEKCLGGVFPVAPTTVNHGAFCGLGSSASFLFIVVAENDQVGVLRNAAHRIFNRLFLRHRRGHFRICLNNDVATHTLHSGLEAHTGTR